MKTLKQGELARCLVAVSCTLAVSLGRAQGIPVYDNAAFLQQVQQVAAWAQQYQQMVQHYQMLTQQLNAIKGARGMGDILNVPAVRQSLPRDFVTQFDTLRSQGRAGASAGALAIYNSIKTFACDQQFPNNQSARLQCEAAAMVQPQNISFINSSIESSQGRVSQLQGLLGQIEQASDAKAAADLSNRINVEIAMLQNEKTMMDMALAQLQTQQKLMEQQKREADLKAVSQGGWNPISSSRR